MQNEEGGLLVSFSAELLFSNLQSKNGKIKTYRTVIFSVIFYGCETWSLTLKEESRSSVLENRVLKEDIWV